MNTCIKYPGGKRWLVPYLQPLFDRHKHLTWADPFCGSLALPFALQPERALLCDRNPHLIDFWRWVQTDGIVTIPMHNDEETYYQYREQFNSTQSDQSIRAQLFYYLLRTGYNGLVRFSRKGNFNVPFGRYKTINYLPHFLEYQNQLLSWLLVSQDYRATLSCLNGDEFLYVDPPYAGGGFTQYSGNTFTDADQDRLANAIATHKGPVVASNAATEEMVELYLYLDFDVEIIEAPRRISCNGDRTPALEILATKNL